jgi:hypothetical protein
LVPVISRKKVLAVLAVNSYVPLSLLNKVDEISSVFHDYQETIRPRHGPAVGGGTNAGASVAAWHAASECEGS